MPNKPRSKEEKFPEGGKVQVTSSRKRSKEAGAQGVKGQGPLGAVLRSLEFKKKELGWGCS